MLSSEFSIDGRGPNGEQLRELGDRVLPGFVELEQQARWGGLSFGGLPLSFPFARAIAIPSRVRIRSKSTSNSANIARILKTLSVAAGQPVIEIHAIIGNAKVA